MNRPTLLFYCQHSLGMGHLVRSFALVRELSREFRVVFLNGGRLPDNLAVPGNIEIVQLPPLGMQEDSSLKSLQPGLSLDDAREIRRQMLLRAGSEHQPDAVVIELFPFGRKKFRDELLPFLDAVRGGAGVSPAVICSLRDILVSDRRDQQKHDDRAAECLQEYFDAVLVHTDPSFARLEDSFRPSRPCATPVHYTGFVIPGIDPHSSSAQRDRRILVSAGGGIVGGPLFRAALGAQRLLWPQLKIPMSIVGGPFLPEDEWQELVRLAAEVPDVNLHRSVRGLAGHMRGVRWSVSQCGYNTAMDVLDSGVTALFVPFQRGGENEQLARARKLSERGLALTLDAPEPEAAALALAILELTEFEPGVAGLDLDGAATSAEIVAGLAGVHDDVGAVAVSGR